MTHLGKTFFYNGIEVIVIKELNGGKVVIQYPGEEEIIEEIVDKQELL